MQDVSCQIWGLTVKVTLFARIEGLMVLYSDNVSTGTGIFNTYFYFITIAIVGDSDQRLQDNKNIKRA